jgi:hypothetical protein
VPGTGPIRRLVGGIDPRTWTISRPRSASPKTPARAPRWRAVTKPRPAAGMTSPSTPSRPPPLDARRSATQAPPFAEFPAKRKAGLNPDPFLLRVSGQSFYNTSPMDMGKLMSDQDHIRQSCVSRRQDARPGARSRGAAALRMAGVYGKGTRGPDFVKSNTAIGLLRKESWPRSSRLIKLPSIRRRGTRWTQCPILGGTFS